MNPLIQNSQKTYKMSWTNIIVEFDCTGSFEFNSPKGINNSLARADNLHEKRVIISSNVAIAKSSLHVKIDLTYHTSEIKPW